MSEPLIESSLFQCDIRGCVGVGEYCYVRTILDRPAVVLVCSLHRFEQWAFVHQMPNAVAGGESDDSDLPRSRSRATISRADWLRLEIEAAEQYVARFRDSADPIERSQVRRREREAVAFQAELAALKSLPAPGPA